MIGLLVVAAYIALCGLLFLLLFRKARQWFDNCKGGNK